MRYLITAFVTITLMQVFLPEHLYEKWHGMTEKLSAYIETLVNDSDLKKELFKDVSH